jgi:serine protease inhibitor
MAPGAAVPRLVEMVPFKPVFRADRPFVYLIRDTKSGAVLFLGRVLDPTREG